MQLANVKLVPITKRAVSPKHIRIARLELKCDAFAHHADKIDRIHQRLRWRIE
jgi:hypothetical protein